MCLDEMGPDAAKSYPGQRLVHAPELGQPTERATQESDYERVALARFEGAAL